ncbi:hypothetical protein C8F01DRAFT_1145277 [Mycena amicta]|nr:hypothetical protein C8F01DRAFT_1145277 [Mycena amicta]
MEATNSLTHILRSQIQLTEYHLPSLLTSLSAQLEQCDDEERRLQIELDALAARRADLLRLREGIRWSGSPIRRVPTEILTEIFAVVVASPFRTLPLEWDEFGLEQLAQQDVLRLAQVCFRWHAIILDTRPLWSFLRISPDLWSVDPHLATALLRRALERSGNSPLTIAVRNDAPPTVLGVPLALLAAHSTRWRRVYFKCYPLALSGHVSSIRGSLPLLEELYLYQGIPTAPLLFNITPKLTRLYIDRKAIGSIASLSLAQLSCLSIMQANTAWLSAAISPVARLPPGSHFSLSFYLDDWTSHRSRNIGFHIPHVISTIGELTIQVTSEFHKHHCKQTLTAVLSALTLPNLHILSLQSEHADRFPLVWAHSAFVALCQRSALGDHLRELDLADVHIAEGPLRQCLALLPALTHLAISDHERIRGRGVNLELISDTLLGALMEHHDETMAMVLVLVPRLKQLSLRSRHAFTDAKLLDMIRSRVNAVDEFSCMLIMMENFRDGSREEHLGRLARERAKEISRIDGRKLRLTI